MRKTRAIPPSDFPFFPFLRSLQGRRAGGRAGPGARGDSFLTGSFQIKALGILRRVEGVGMDAVEYRLAHFPWSQQLRFRCQQMVTEVPRSLEVPAPAQLHTCLGPASRTN